MTSLQRFHPSNALRRTKKPTPDTPRFAPGSENGKITRLLGAEAGFDTRSLSVATTAYETRRTDSDYLEERLPSVVVSAASTVFGTSAEPSSDQWQRSNDLDTKPSSILLREVYHAGSQHSGSSQTKDLRNYGSSSTLHSHYEARSTPLVISQQTSESSARDRALRKGCSMVILPNEGEVDPLPQLESIEFRKGDAKLRKTKSRTNRIDFSLLFPTPGSGRKPVASSELGDAVARSSTVRAAEVTENVSIKKRLAPWSEPSEQETVRPSGGRQRLSTVHGNPAYFKVNVRKPKAGVKNWFDDDQENSSDEENGHGEPELQQNFVDGIESAFREGTIRPYTASEVVAPDAGQPQTFLESPAVRTIASKPSYSPLCTLAGPAEPGRPLTLHIPALIARSSDPVCFPVERMTLRQQKSRRFDDVNLQQQSVLYLSSSEDEDECHAPARRQPRKAVIRDSLAAGSMFDAEIEIGTAQAVSKRAIPEIKRLRSVADRSRFQETLIRVPQRTSSRMLSYISNQSSTPHTEIPTPPSEVAVTPGAASWTDSVRSSTATRRESTKLMNVTRQEEVLLAQMRLKRAGMRTDSSSSVRRRDSDASRSSFVLHQPQPKTSGTAMTVAEYLDHGLRRDSTLSNSTRFRDSGSENDRQTREAYSRASVTTFQTNRASATTFQTSTTREEDIHCSPSPTESNRSPATPSQVSARDLSFSGGLNTQFTSSSDVYHNHPRTRTDSSHIIVLDDLEVSPKRDARSQDFIEYPYSGWKSMAGIAAH